MTIIDVKDARSVIHPVSLYSERNLVSVTQAAGAAVTTTGSGTSEGSLTRGSVTLAVGGNDNIPGRIYCEGRQFKNAGQTMYLNGANTPWRYFNEFGATSGATYDSAWWEAEFTLLEERGLNSTRIWINDDPANQGVILDSTGLVTEVTALFWANLDDMLARAAAHGIYVMVSVVSFDHFSWNNANSLKYHLMMGKESNVQSWIDQFIIPLADRHADNLFLYAIDLGNETDNFFEDQATASPSSGTCTPVGGGSTTVNFGSRLDDFVVGQSLYVNGFDMGPVVTRVNDTQCIATNGYAGASATFNTGNPDYDWGWLGKSPATYQRYIAMCAAAIHNRPTIAPLVTVGVQSIKYSTSAYGASDYYADSVLSAFTDDAASFIDYHSIHYYQWAEAFFPLRVTPTAAGLSAKPATYGELPGGWENLNGIYRNGGWVRKWWPRTYYGVDSIVHVDDGTNKRLYRCVTAGTSGPTAGVAGQDVGPTGTGSGIADGGCVWDYCLNNSTFLGLTAYSLYQMVISYDLGVWVCSTAGTTSNSGGPNGTGPTFTDGTATFTYRRQAYTDEQDLYDWLAANGWCGHYPWTSNAIGFNGGLYHVDLVSTPNKIVNWVASTAYAQDAKVYNDTGKIYRCLVAGTSAGSGGPTGTGASIADGGATWCYEKTVASPPWTSTGLAIKTFSDANTATIFPDTSAPWDNSGTVVRESSYRGWVNADGSVRFKLGFILRDGVADAVKRVGAFDDQAGIFLAATGSANTLSIVIRSAGTDAGIPRDSWNVDKLDGNGASGLSLDPTKAQILCIDFNPAGITRIGFVLSGITYWAHQFAAGNADPLILSRTNLPIRWNMAAESAIANEVYFECFDGAATTSDPARVMTLHTSPQATTPSGVGASVTLETLALRIAPTQAHLITAKLKRLVIRGASTSGEYPFSWTLSLTGATGTPAWLAVTGSGMESSPGRGVYTPGTVLAAGFGDEEVDVAFDSMPQLAAGDVVSLQITNLHGSDNYFQSYLSWDEG